MSVGHSRVVALLSLLLLAVIHPSLQAQDFFAPNRFEGIGGFDGKPAAALDTAAKVDVSAEFTSASADAPAMLYVTADVLEGWHIYSITQAAGGPLQSKLKLDASDAFRLAGPWQALNKPAVHSYPDAWPGLAVEEHAGHVTWAAPTEFAAGIDPKTVEIKGSLYAQACKETCDLPKDFNFTAKWADQPSAAVSAATESVAHRAEPSAGSAAPAEYRKAGNHTLLRAQVQVISSDKLQLAITATADPGWHVYALAERDPQQISKPALIEFVSTPGVTFSRPVANREPQEKESPAIPGYFDKVHKGEVTWTSDISLSSATNASPRVATGYIGYQACDDSNCDRPDGTKFDITIPAGPLTVGSLLPITLSEDYYDNAAKLSESRSLTIDDGFVLTAEGQAPQTVWNYLAAGLLGGFILNFMPCVLPVVGLKILSFVEQGKHQRSRVFMLNLWYTAGILAVFMVLATLPVLWQSFFGEQYVWGKQFGSSTFNIWLAALVFAMALSLIGVWEIPIPGFVGSGSVGKLATQEGASGAFAKGVITTILATPCSGPFVGGAIGWAFKQPPHTVYAVFAAVGLGMASPYLLIGAFPRLIRWLPKPGAWMETFKQIMGFVLLGTVVYLLTLVTWVDLIPTVALLIGIWAACWWIGKTPFTADFSRKATAWASACAFMAIVGYLAFARLGPEMAKRFEDTVTAEITERMKAPAAAEVDVSANPDALPWEPFSKAKLQELASARSTVIVDFTAKWCLNCIALKKAVLNTAAVKKVVEENGIVPLVADLDVSPDSTLLLNALEGGAIPVLAIFPAGDPKHPIVFRNGYTQAMLIEALEKAGPSQSAASLAWQPFSKAKLEELVKAQRTVIVEFTHRWDLTPAALRKTALDTANVKSLVEKNRIVALSADIDDSPENEEAWRAVDAREFPVLAIYSPQGLNRPIVLDGYITEQAVLDALTKATKFQAASAAVTDSLNVSPAGAVAVQNP